MRRFLLLGLLFPCFCFAGSTLTLCEDSESVFPWTLPNRAGLNRILLESVAKELQLELKIIHQPWARCLSDLTHNKIDGVYPVSYSPERSKQFNYPQHLGQPNTKQRLMTDSYSLYRLKGDQRVQWNGKKLLIPHAQSVGVQRGYSIAAHLSGMGIKTDEGAYPVNANLQKLLYQRVAAVALRTGAGDFEIASQLPLARAIEKLNPPLVTKPYFLVLSKQFSQFNPDLAFKIWQTIEQERESKMYLAIEEHYR